MINSPSKYQSYTNYANRITDYQGFLIEVDREIIKKKIIQPNQNSPKIGTFRLNTSNFEKRSLTERDQLSYLHFCSISLDKNLINLSPTQLRIEDYYLLRTAPTYSQLYKSIPNVTSFGCLINKSLLSANNLKQPNFNQIVQEQPIKRLTATNQFGAFQTPNDRLAKIKQNTNISPNQLIQSISSLQQNSFTNNNLVRSPEKSSEPLQSTSGIRPLQMQQMNEIQMNYFRLNRNSSPLDIFLQFFGKQLKISYDKKQSVYPIIETYLGKCFMINQRAEQIKRMYLHDIQTQSYTPQEYTSAIFKKYAECIEMKKMIQGFHLELQGKMGRNQFDSNMLQYSHDILRILQDIYSARIRQLYRYCDDQITEESMNKIKESLYQKQSTLLFKYQNITNYHNPQVLTLPMTYLPKQVQIIPTPIHINKTYIDYHDLERQQLQNQIFFMNSLNNHLQCLYQRQKLQREEHLYDIVNKYQEPIESDYYLWQRSKRKKTTEIFFIQEQNKQTTLPLSSNKKSINTSQPSLKVSQFSIGNNRSHWIIHFKVQIIWVDSNQKRQQLYKKFKGSFKISQKETKQSIQHYIRNTLLVHYKRIIRVNAKFQFGQLSKQQKGKNIYQTNIIIFQKKINLPTSYNFSAEFKLKNNKGVELTKLIISNQFGQITWEHSINIQSLDFMRDFFQIGNSTVHCECDCLNIPCMITFYQFSQYIVRLEKKYYHDAIEEKVKNYIKTFPNCNLVNIDWNKRHYTLQSQEFFFNSEEDKAKEYQESKQSQALLKQLEQRFSIQDLLLEEENIVPKKQFAHPIKKLPPSMIK